MGIFDGSFSAEDAAVIGGIMGFAEESVEVEEQKLEVIPEETIQDTESSATDDNINLRLIRNENPELFRYVIQLAQAQAIRWAKNRQDQEAVAEELEALARSEKELEELEGNDVDRGSES